MTPAQRKLLLTAQNFSYGRVLAHVPLATVTAIQERRAVTAEAAKQLLTARNNRNGKIGACIIVNRPAFFPGLDDSSLRGVMLHSFTVLEHPTLNEGSQGTGLSAEEIAIELFQLFAFAPMGLNSQQVYSPAPGGAVLPDDTYDGYNGWATRLQSAAACPRDERCGLVLIAPDEGAGPLEVTLTTATAGASIYYTLDADEYPSSANPAALLYSAPFTVPAGTTLTAAAEKTGMQQSGLSQATFT